MLRIVLRVLFELADVNLANERRNVLIVFVAGFGLGDRNLLQDGWRALDDAELRDITAVLVQAFHCPRRHDVVQVPARNAIVLLEYVPVLGCVEQSKRRLMDGRTLERIKRYFLHQRFQFLGEGRLSASPTGPSRYRICFLSSRP